VYKDNYNAAQSSLSSLKSQLASKENERTEKSNLLASTKSRIENEAKVARQVEEARIKREIAQKKAKETSIGTEITAINDQKALFQGEIDVLKEEINNYKNQLSSLNGAKKVTRAEQIATKEVAVAYKTIERLAVEKNIAAKQIAQAQVKLARLELQNRLTKDQASSISSIKAKIQALKSKEKSLKQKYEEWLAKKKAREATLVQKTAAVKTALAEAKRAAGIKEQRLKEEAIAKQQEEKVAKAAAARVQSENAEKANTRINSQLQKAQEIVELRDVNFADGKNKVNKTFVKTREEDDVYEKKVNFRTKAVLYFKNGAPVTKENYESELGAKRAAWKATNN
jgi:chromosome segregation ATPase